MEYVVSLLQRETSGHFEPADFRDAMRLYVGEVPPVFSEERLTAARKQLRDLPWAMVCSSRRWFP